jgi:phenylacetate-CoA ligase
MIYQLYHHLPVWAQNILVSVKGYSIERLRFGNDFNLILEQSINRMQLNEEQLKRYQELCMSSFLKAATTSPFWSKRFEEYNVDINSNDLFSEIKKLPILTKDEVKRHSSAIRTAKISNREVITSKTSGSTGSSLVYYETRAALQQRWAIWWRYRLWHNIDFRSWAGIFGAKQVVSVNKNNPPFYRINFPGKQIRFSINHIKPANINNYYNGLKNVNWIAGYPSAISLVGSLMLENWCKPIESIRVITTGAETLLPNQRDRIEKAFNVPVRQSYGQAESVANFSECEKGKLHVDEDFSFVEFEPIEIYSNCFKIIGTNWTNPYFPLIRYDTADIAYLSHEKCSCGKWGRIVEYVDGRIEDYILLPNGSKVGRLSQIFTNTKSIKEGQLYQPDLNNIIIRIVKDINYDANKVEYKLLNEAKKWLGSDINIHISYLEEIPKTRSGKLRLVVSDIKENNLDN